MADLTLTNVERISKFIGCDFTGIRESLLNDDIFIKN